MLSTEVLATLFTEARSHNAWLDQAVSDAELKQLYDVMKWGPTSANCSPARIIFIRTPEGREKLLPAMSAGNQEKTRNAPVIAIIGMDMAFFDKLPELFPHADAKAWFVGNHAMIAATAFRNSALQGAYLMLAARAIGLDVGPMSGFDAEKVNAAFFAGTEVKVNFICNLGHGDGSKMFARSPRLAFESACQLQ